MPGYLNMASIPPPPSRPSVSVQNPKSSILTCIMCVQYIGGCSVHRGVFSTSGDTMSTSGDIMSTSGDVQYIGGYHDERGDTMSTSGDVSGGYHEYIGDVHTSEGYHDTCGGAT